MKLFILAVTILLLNGCGSKRITINGLICPEDYSTHQVQKDLMQCKYYDEKKAAEASMSPIRPECIECLESKGYELER